MAKDDNIQGGQMIAYFAVAVIAISLFVIGARLTGFDVLTDTAEVNVTISPLAAINFTTDFIDFGTGTVLLGAANAMLESNGTAAVNGTWSWTAQYFELENIGNINVSLKLKSGKTAAQFLGGSSPSYEYVVRDTESGSCIDIPAGWQTATGSDATICSSFKIKDSNDRIRIDVKLVIPSDSNSGTGGFTDTFTATGTAGA